SATEEDEVRHGKFGGNFAGASGKSGAAILESDSGSFAACGGGLCRQTAGSERWQVCEGASLDFSQHRVRVMGDSDWPGNFQHGRSAGDFSCGRGYIRILAESGNRVAGRAIFAWGCVEAWRNEPGPGGN